MTEEQADTIIRQLSVVIFLLSLITGVVLVSPWLKALGVWIGAR